MFSLSKGEPPTPPNTATSPPTSDLGVTPCELPQFQKADRTHSAPTALSRESHETKKGVPILNNPANRAQSAPVERDSGFEASPSCFTDPPRFIWETAVFDEVSGFDEVFLDDDAPRLMFEEENAPIHLLEPEEVSPHSIDEEESVYLFEEDPSGLLLEREDDDWCPECGHISSCTCSRAESSATVRGPVSSYTDPNTCDSDSSHRSSSPQSPPPSSWPIPATCSHIHNDRLPCPRCNDDDPAPSGSYLQNIVASRSYPGSYPASVLHLWTQSSPSSSVFSPRVAAALSRSSNRSEDRRSRRRQIDSDASSSSSGDENSADELFPTPCEGGSYLADLAMTEAEELRVTSPEQLPDLVPISAESSSRRARSQSVSIPLDQDYIREIGSSLRRFSNEFENRLAERSGQPRRASLTSFLNW